MPDSTAPQRTLESLTSSFHTVCSCWAWVGGSYRCLSGDALRHRHAEPGHPVERRAGDPGLGLLAGQSPGAEATTDDGLVGVTTRSVQNRTLSPTIAVRGDNA